MGYYNGMKWHVEEMMQDYELDDTQRYFFLENLRFQAEMDLATGGGDEGYLDEIIRLQAEASEARKAKGYNH